MQCSHCHSAGESGIGCSDLEQLSRDGKQAAQRSQPIAGACLMLMLLL